MQHMAEEQQVHLCHMIPKLFLQPLELWGGFVYSLIKIRLVKVGQC